MSWIFILTSPANVGSKGRRGSIFKTENVADMLSRLLGWIIDHLSADRHGCHGWPGACHCKCGCDKHEGENKQNGHLQELFHIPPFERLKKNVDILPFCSIFVLWTISNPTYLFLRIYLSGEYNKKQARKKIPFKKAPWRIRSINHSGLFLH